MRRRGYDDPTLAAEHSAQVDQWERTEQRASRTPAIVAAFALAGGVFIAAVLIGTLAQIAWYAIQLGWNL